MCPSVFNHHEMRIVASTLEAVRSYISDGVNGRQYFVLACCQRPSFQLSDNISKLVMGDVLLQQASQPWLTLTSSGEC